MQSAECAVIAEAMITAMQCRLARTALGWNQEELAKAIGVSAGTIKNFEAGQRTIMPVISTAIERTLTEAGVVFVPEDDEFVPGVRLRKPQAGPGVRQQKAAPPLAPDAPPQDRNES